MKTPLIHLTLLTYPVALTAAPDDRFHGGSRDGSATAVLTSYTVPTGGEERRFVGGAGDGNDSSLFSSWTEPAGGEERRFVGGANDGSDVGSYQGWTPPVGGIFARFLGGGYDGHAKSGVDGLPNPLSGDLDGDGVPDWWESLHYRSLTLTGALTDLDHDGQGSRDEYLWDTDPNDPGSRFKVLDLQRGETAELTFSSSSPNRHYRLEASTDLGPENWTPVNESPVTGNGGDLTLSGPWGDFARSFFRVKVSPE